MTKKDYIIIAKSIWRSEFIKDKDKKRQNAKEKIRHLIAVDISSELENDNPRFDRKKFLSACGL